MRFCFFLLLPAATNVAFGNVNDKNATLSSSPAAPPSFNTNPKAFGTVPVASPAASATSSAAKPALDIHSFFTGGASPSQTSATLPSTPGGPERRSVATYDPATNRSSPLPNPSNLSNSLSGNPQAFTPRQPLPFVPQQQHQLQQQQNFSSAAYGLGPPPPFHPQQHQQGGLSYPQQHGKSQAQNIPNGGGNYGQQQQGGPNGQRSGSFVGSPVMRGQPGTPTGRQQFPTSPRLGNAGLPQQQPGMMGYSPQGWNPQQQVSRELVLNCWPQKLMQHLFCFERLHSVATMLSTPECSSSSKHTLADLTPSFLSSSNSTDPLPPSPPPDLPHLPLVFALLSHPLRSPLCHPPFHLALLPLHHLSTTHLPFLNPLPSLTTLTFSTR